MSKKLVPSGPWCMAVGVNEAAAPGQKQKSSLQGTGEARTHRLSGACVMSVAVFKLQPNFGCAPFLLPRDGRK